MFFSVDLLSLRGGKMNTIWLLGTLNKNEKNAVIKKKKAELLRNDLKVICQDLVAKFPVKGKQTSLSLRTSAHLVYGVCINLRVQCEDLCKAALNVLSIKAVPRDLGIDMPAGPSRRVTLTGLIDMDDMAAVLELQTSDQELDAASFPTRAALREITMLEPTTRDLEFGGVELPIIPEDELQQQLANNWNLEDGDWTEKRDREGEDEVPAAKRSRSEEVEERGEATVLGPEEELAEPEAPGRRTQAPRIEVTPAVTGVSGSRRTSPPQLQLEAADQGLGLPEAPGPEDLAAQQQDQEAAVPVQEPEEPFLQPLVPAAPVRGRARGRAAARPVVDTRLQLGGEVIKRNMQDGWRASLRSENTAQDLVLAGQGPAAGLGDRLAAQLTELARRGPARQQAWDWQEDGPGDQGAGVPVEAEGQEAPVEEERRPVPGEASMAGNMTATSLGREGSVVGDTSAAREVSAAGAGTSGLQLPGLEPALDVTPVQEVPGPADEALHGGVEAEGTVNNGGIEAEAGGAVNYGGVELEGTMDQAEASRAAAEGTKVSMDAVLATVRAACDGPSGFCTFEQLCPPGTTDRGVAALTFYKILKAEKLGKVTTKQEEAFGPITIFSED